MAESDEDFELEPVVGDGLTNDERLDTAVAHMDGVTEDIDLEEGPYVGQLAYGRTWLFSFATGRFERYGTAPAEITGIDTLKMWCEKVLHTFADAHVIYPPDIGIDPIEIIGGQYDGAAFSELMETVREALLAHDRIERVDEMTVEQPTLDDDYVVVSMTVVTDSEVFELETEVVAA